MKKLVSSFVFLFCSFCFAQNSNSVVATVKPISASITFLEPSVNIKELAKEIAMFRSKEYIINNIIGDAKGNQVKFETESLASDDSGGIISVAFNSKQIDKKGLLLAFFGTNRNQYGVYSKAYDFKYIPLDEAKELLNYIDEIINKENKYLSKDNNVNNIYIEHKDIKFVIYYDTSPKIRVFWNGFEVVWESTAFNRSKKRLTKWFE